MWFVTKWCLIGTATTNHRQACNRLHQVEKFRNLSGIKITISHNDNESTEFANADIQNNNVVQPVIQQNTNDPDTISNEHNDDNLYELCDDYEGQFVNEHMVQNMVEKNYDFDDFDIAENENTKDIYDTENDTSSTANGKKN